MASRNARPHIWGNKIRGTTISGASLAYSHFIPSYKKSKYSFTYGGLEDYARGHLRTALPHSAPPLAGRQATAQCRKLPRRDPSRQQPLQG